MRAQTHTHTKNSANPHHQQHAAAGLFQQVHNNWRHSLPSIELKKKKNPVVWRKQLSGTHHAGSFCCPKAEPHSAVDTCRNCASHHCSLFTFRIYIHIYSSYSVESCATNQMNLWLWEKFLMEGFKFVLLLCLLICQAAATDRHEVTMCKSHYFPWEMKQNATECSVCRVPESSIRSFKATRWTTTTLSLNLFLCSSKCSSS